MEEFFYSRIGSFNFLGPKKQNYKTAKIVIFPVPYSSTTYWKSGTKEGPRAIIEASPYLEVYDIEVKKDLSRLGIFTLPFLKPSKNSPQETITKIKKVIDKLLKDKKFSITLGGEHSITLGPVQAFKEHFFDFSVLQIDAHPDLRNEFEGTKFHHACVMKRVKDLGIPITSVGIRSISEKEKVENEKMFLAPELPIDKIISSLRENVYLTIDLDALDPSIMPSVGTPDPGGLGWYELLGLIKQLAQKRKIIGADVVELCPIPGLIAPDFLGAKLIYKIINYIFQY